MSALFEWLPGRKGLPFPGYGTPRGVALRWLGPASRGVHCAMRRGVCMLVGLVLLSANVAGAGALDSGISGRIVAGPTCPVESVPPAPGCAARPLRATLLIRRVGGHGGATIVRSAADGRFRVGLAAGTYVVRALARAGATLPRPPATSRVQVRVGRYTFVTITYDTGIR